MYISLLYSLYNANAQFLQHLPFIQPCTGGLNVSLLNERKYDWVCGL